MRYHLHLISTKLKQNCGKLKQKCGYYKMIVFCFLLYSSLGLMFKHKRCVASSMLFKLMFKGWCINPQSKTDPAKSLHAYKYTAIPYLGSLFRSMTDNVSRTNPLTKWPRYPLNTYKPPHNIANTSSHLIGKTCWYVFKYDVSRGIVIVLNTKTCDP